jgi:hypothetical protein
MAIRSNNLTSNLLPSAAAPLGLQHFRAAGVF